MTPHRAVGKHKRLVFTDHYSLQLIFENIPLKPYQKRTIDKQTVWNTNKPGGWDKYNELSDDNDDLNRLADDNLANTTELDQKLEKIMNKIKYKSFGKVSFSNRN